MGSKPRSQLSLIETTIYTGSNIEPSTMAHLVDSLTRQGKRIRDRLRGKKHKPGKPGANTPGESVDSSGSSLQPESSIAERGNDRGWGGSNAPEQQVRSGDESPHPGTTPGSGGGDRRETEASADEKKVNQSNLRPDANVGVTVGSEPSQEVEQVQPSPPLPPAGQLGSM